MWMWMTATQTISITENDIEEGEGMGWEDMAHMKCMANQTREHKRTYSLRQVTPRNAWSDLLLRNR
jgi:hypothetical protein